MEHVRQDGERLGAVAGTAASAEVPSCPGWSMGDLVRHVAQVYEHKIACTTLRHEPDPWPPVWQARDPLDWLSDAHARLLAMFARSEPTTPSYTWWPPDQTVGFWARRMAHETAVHRFDAELAAGTPTLIKADLAADGVDEILSVMLEGDWSDEPDETATGARVAVSTAGRTWTVALERESVSVTEGDEAGSANPRLSGDPSDIDLWLWGRIPDDRVTRSGDLQAIRELRSRLALAT